MAGVIKQAEENYQEQQMSLAPLLDTNQFLVMFPGSIVGRYPNWPRSYLQDETLAGLSGVLAPVTADGPGDLPMESEPAIVIAICKLFIIRKS